MKYKNFHEFENSDSIPFSKKKYEEVLNILLQAKELLPKE